MVRFLWAILLLQMLAGGAIASAQEPYSAKDPRWNDGDTSNDPNTCFESGANCRTREEWDRGWLEATCLASLPPCVQAPIGSRSGGGGGSSSGGGGGSSSGGGGGSSRGIGGIQPSANAGGVARNQDSPRYSASSRGSSGRTLPPCPIGKVCVDYWPSRDHYVFEVDNCCYPQQAIYSIVEGREGYNPFK